MTPLEDFSRDRHSVFERLIYVGTLINQLAGLYGGEGPDGGTLRQTLRREHRVAFERWLCLNLEDKMSDLEAYANDHGGTVLDVLRCWILPHCNPNLIPPGAAAPQRELFELDFEVLLPIMAAKSDAASNRVQLVHQGTRRDLALITGA